LLFLVSSVREFALLFLTIFIACLGLFGLSVYNTQLQIKETGIRKILDATSFRIALLIIRDTAVLIFISILIAIPVGWWAMNQLLQNFSYHISLNLLLFVFIALMSMIISIATISLQLIKAAFSNPIKSIKST